jgi:integrase
MQSIDQSRTSTNANGAWNSGRLIGQKPPLKRKDIWAIRVRLQLSDQKRDLALFNLAIDSKLRGCDLVAIRIADISTGQEIHSRAIVIQKKTGRPVQFEITEPTREAISIWLDTMRHRDGGYLFSSRMHHGGHLSTRQYARLVKSWTAAIGLDPRSYGTHSLRRTKSTLIYRRTHNLRAVQLLLGHTKLESTVRYLGIEVDDALAIAEETEI